ncbi:uncharacterized protein LOC134747583 [Cydia strobilella]|uniref:uncharacterized protein LOC134747583 n=1 Tax=Cydia strobilella TaxID=1100964 RepID=UPI003006FEF4
MSIIMSFQWTNQNVFKLIEMFEERELLWNTMLEEYKDRNKKHKAWYEIANAFELERSVVEKKMRSLIGQFQRELKKDKSGVGCDEVSNWFAFKKLMFLRNHNKPASTRDIGEKNSHNDELSEPYHVENFHIAAPMPMVYESTDTTANLSTISRKRTNSYDDKSDDPMGYGFAKQYQPSSKSGHDEFEIYGQYVASELRETKDLHSVLVAKRYINDILINARMGKYRKDSASNNSKSKGIKTEQEHDSDINDDE